MKKLLTILFAFGFTAAIAQPNKSGNYERQPQRETRNDDRANDNNRYDDHSNDNRKYDNSYVFTSREKDAQIARINWDFDSRVRAIESDRFLRNRQKRKEIEKVESDRSQTIRDVIAKFNDKRNRGNSPYAYDRTRRY